MNRAELINLGWYALYALGGAIVATGVQLGVVLAGDGDILWRPLAATFVTSLFGALATAAGASTLSRYGSEGLASDVNALRDRGWHRDELTVVPKPELTEAIAGGPMSDAQVRQVADEIERRLKLEAG